MIGRRRGRRRDSFGGFGGWMLKPFIYLALLLALLSMYQPKADAAAIATAGAEKPRIACGANVTWGMTSTYAPAMGEQGIGWAWKQVAPVARLTVTADAFPEHRWEFQHPLSGGIYAPGTVEDRGDEIVHAEDADRDWTLGAVKSVALRGILRELGVTNPTSTAAGLSKADATALRKVCRAAGVNPGKPGTPSQGDRDVAASDAAQTAGGDAKPLPVAPDVVQWLAIATLPAAVALLVFLVSPSALPTGAAWVRARITKAQTGEDEAGEDQK